jgi:hypothetical protein
MERREVEEYDIRDVIDMHLCVKKAMELVELANPRQERIIVVIYSETVHQLEIK